MRRTLIRKSMLAAALAVALPLSASSATDSRIDSGAALADLVASAGVLDAWRDYALESLKPNFSWASDGEPIAHAPSLFERSRARLTPVAHFNGAATDASPVHVALLSSKVGDTPLFVGADQPNLLPDYSPGFRRYIVAPSLTQRWGESSFVTVSAILAYQRLAGFGDAEFAPVQTDFRSALRPTETSFGSGARVDVSNALNERLSWQFGYQTRVNMDSFASYRSFFTQPGTFDIPASTNLGLDYALTPQLRVNAQVERVMYGQISPFISSSLPPALLAVLSSSLSPAFAWQNLDVYSIGWVWHDRDSGDFSLRYSSREQPLPTSALLRDALGAHPSSYNVEFGYARAFGVDSMLRVAATYAPTQYVFGVPVGYNLNSNLGSNQFQFEALWTTHF